MSVKEHLLAMKLLSLDGFVDNESVLQLYYDMTDNALFVHSMVTAPEGETPHAGRVSETAYAGTFTAVATAALDRLNDRLCELLAVKKDQFEPWQCTRYGTGGQFDYHNDCGSWASNERLYTVMLTLRAPATGGQTHFRALNKIVDSKSGRLLIWRNLNEDYLCDGQAVHAGLPVGTEGTEDEKMILVTWIRRFKYDS